MPSARTITYPDGLYFPAALRAVQNAQSSIQVMAFLIKTSYVGETHSKQFCEALKAAARRGVTVLVVENYSRFEMDVASDNWATAQDLAAAGCIVKMGPRNRTLHTKMLIVDLIHVFIGSHNLTRGGLDFNYELTVYSTTMEMIRRGSDYFNYVWYGCTYLADTPPPDTTYEPLTIALESFTTVGNEIELTFSVNHTEDVDAFAAVSDDALNLQGANMGPTVTTDVRTARVTPLVEPGQMVFLAVRAYRAGTVEATSNTHSMIYQPAEQNGGDGEPGNGGTEPPPPEPLTAPTVTSVTQASLPATVTVDWTFVGAENFQQFIIQQRDLEQVWHPIGVVIDANAREWTGAANSMDSINPFRVVVYNTANESATSNEVLLTMPALTAPVLESVVAGLNGTEITVTWTFPGCENFHRFEIQKAVGSEWSVVGSTLDPAVRQWVGPGPGTIEPTTYRVVVFNMAEESAASNEITITGETPVPLTAPVLVSVTQIGPMGINVEYSHVTPAEFARYEVQQRTNGSWQTLGTITTPETRSWAGGPVPYVDADHPVRVVVFVQSGDSAGSNEMVITPM